MVWQRFLWSTSSVWEVFSVRMSYLFFYIWMRWNLLPDSHRNSNTVLRSQKDTQRSGLESEVFLTFSEFFFFFFYKRNSQEREREGPNSREQVWSNQYQVSSTRQRGSLSAFHRALAPSHSHVPELPHSGPHRPQVPLALCFHGNKEPLWDHPLLLG